MPKNVVLIGTLDTKGVEFAYVSRPNWDTYASLLDFAARVRRDQHAAAEPYPLGYRAGHREGDQAAGAEPGPQPDPDRRQMPIHQQGPAGLELPQRLRR